MKWKDRIEALKRSEKYRKDYEEYEKWRIEHDTTEYGVLDTFEQKMSDKAEALCEKYRIPFPIPPKDTMIFGPNEEVLGGIEERTKTPAIRVRRRKLGNNEGYGHVTQEGQFITVQITIDTSKTQEQVEYEFKTLYKHLLSQGSGRKRRPRTSLTYQGKEIDHWFVFDKMTEKKNLSSVMKEFFSITKNPTYNKEAKARYEQVRRYYQKALNLMREFEGK
jgi:hypothetical protein